MRWFIVPAAFAASVFALVSVQAQAPAPAPAQAPGPFQSATAPGANPLPPGEGRDIVAVACTQCHAPSAFAQLRQGEQAWRAQVYDMILRGAEINPNDIDAAVKYLTINFGPGVNVPPSAPVTLPDGPGKEMVEGGCALCHGLDRIAETKRSPAQWQNIVNRMIFFGSPLSPDQAKTVVAYLGNQFGAK